MAEESHPKEVQLIIYLLLLYSFMLYIYIYLYLCSFVVFEPYVIIHL